MAAGAHRHALTPPADPAEPPSLDRAENRDRKQGDQTAWEAYMASCTDYIKRQLIVYQNWPQRKYDTTGYRREKVFSDQNN
jgi:hypothetical protein